MAEVNEKKESLDFLWWWCGIAAVGLLVAFVIGFNAPLTSSSASQSAFERDVARLQSDMPSLSETQAASLVWTCQQVQRTKFSNMTPEMVKTMDMCRLFGR